jgi:hypothetical protein
MIERFDAQLFGPAGKIPRVEASHGLEKVSDIRELHFRFGVSHQAPRNSPTPRFHEFQLFQTFDRCAPFQSPE